MFLLTVEIAKARDAAGKNIWGQSKNPGVMLTGLIDY